MDLELHLEIQSLSMAMTVLKKQENSHGNKMPQVDLIGTEIVKKYGLEKLNEIAKLNFKNIEKIKANLK